MVREAGLTAVDLMRHVRDHLLTLWREWEHAPRTNRPKILLQQDIELAVWLVGLINGEPVPHDDPFWGFPADQESREWAPLASVLPLEANDAKREFPSHADIVLSDSEFNQVVPQDRQLNESAIEKLTDKWWRHSATFRRFALAYGRLYGHYVGRINEQQLLSLEEETPIEFLILCALHFEKLLGELLSPDPPTGFNERVWEAARRIAKPYGIHDQQAFSKELHEALRGKAKLYNLPQNPRDPFVQKSKDFKHAEPVARFFLKIFVNFAVMRNYSAHHDCIDEQLFHEGWVAAGVEALMVITLTILTVSCPP
jgi:hypothetical protein